MPILIIKNWSFKFLLELKSYSEFIDGELTLRISRFVLLVLDRTEFCKSNNLLFKISAGSGVDSSDRVLLSIEGET